MIHVHWYRRTGRTRASNFDLDYHPYYAQFQCRCGATKWKWQRRYQ